MLIFNNKTLLGLPIKRMLLQKKTIIVFITFSLLFNSCSLIKPIEFKKINSFKVEENSGKVVLKANLTLYNPNSFKFTIQEADIDVFAEGVNLGKLQVPDTIAMQKNDYFTGDFKVEINLVKLLMAGKNILPKLRQEAINIELKGYVNANVLWINKQFEVAHKESINLKM